MKLLTRLCLWLGFIFLTGVMVRGETVPILEDALAMSFVLEVSRHGHRGSFKDLGSGITQKVRGGHEKRYTEPILTDLGRSESFNLGQLRRKEYINEKQFLRSKFAHKQVLIATTDSDRTFSTAKEFFKGLYPFTSFDLNEEIDSF